MACFRLETKTAAAWTAENPRLARGQVGVETDPDTGEYGKAKLADGVRRWNDLAYWNPADSVDSTAAANIADPTGAATDQDDEARAAIEDILDLLEAAGLMQAAA